VLSSPAGRVRAASGGCVSIQLDAAMLRTWPVLPASRPPLPALQPESIGNPSDMETRDDLSAAAPPALARFLERVHKSFSHDLGAPLGSIVNYACVLESGQVGAPRDQDGAQPGGEAQGNEVRELGRRIRTNAMRAARMIQLLATATGLASRPLHAGLTDVLPLAKSVLMDAGGRGQVRGVEAGSALVGLDPDLISFVWRAYVAVENDARGKPTDDAALQVTEEDGHVLIEMRCNANGSVPGERTEPASFMQQNVGPARMESSMGFGLAEDLVLSHGGEFEVWGRPGRSSALRLRFPLRA
jgi:K+-sensing histidine kinase KdpD